MITLRATLELHTAFGTPLAGDTLFGQLCWAAREHLGEAELDRLLEGYTAGEPWLVVSDGFPAGYLPKPTLPASVGANSVGANSFARKAEKAKHWIPLSAIGLPLPQLLAAAVGANSVGANLFAHSPIEAPQPHNTLNRLTGTTGEGEFAPYTQPQIFFARGQRMDMYCVLDETRMSQDTLLTLLQAIGSCGYGRDASIGLGKFSIETSHVGANCELSPDGEMHARIVAFVQDIGNRSNKFEPTNQPTNHPLVGANVVGANLFARSNEFEPTAYLTLAPCAPQGRGFDGNKSYWRVLTRFGRHGNLHGISEKPFKNPVLLAATGAVFIPQAEYAPRQFIGQGLGGSGQLSKVEPATVQQGYAPVVGIRMEV